MSWPRHLLLCLPAALTIALAASASDFGRPASPDDVRVWNIDVLPDGTGLPSGSGSVARGQEVFAENCAACHGHRGQGGVADSLVGGQGSLGSAHPVKTVGSFWPYAPTLFDYVRRAMPFPAPQSLSDDDTYAVVAYVLRLNGLIPDGAVMDRTSLPLVRMPNRDGFVPDAEFRAIRNSRMWQAAGP
ncbi:c-type cytochrome (plasmid) [Roseomonas sp. CCTCC AB2023176]|uniref:c-type cytochrome n=1 Tax=Roseomonas sp. CCTCC AB2023176 TaxID=3342640 RepID=UPI0035D99124